MKKRIFVFPRTGQSLFRVYEIHGDDSAKLSDKSLKFLAAKLFCDSVCEYFKTRYARRGASNPCIVWFKEGVYDAEGEMAYYCAQKLGLAAGMLKIKFGRGCVGCGELEAGFEFNPLVEVLEKL